MFISSGTVEASKRSRRRKARACIFSLIFAARPFPQSSARALLLKLLIMVRPCKRLADFCQQLAYLDDRFVIGHHFAAAPSRRGSHVRLGSPRGRDPALT